MTKEKALRPFIVEEKNEEGEIIGSAEYYILNDPTRDLVWAYVVNVEVREDKRRRGIGTTLMAKIEQEAKSNGCKFLKLTTRFSNRDAIAFYNKLGYWESVAFGKDI